MSRSTDSPRVLFVGDPPDAATALAHRAGVAAVTVVADAATALEFVPHADCVVCAADDPDAVLRRVRTVAPGVGAVVVAPDDAHHQYDAAWRPPDGEAALADAVASATAGSRAEQTTGESTDGSAPRGPDDDSCCEGRARASAVEAALDDLVFFLDGDYRLVEWNDAVAAATGRGDAALNGMDTLSLLDEESAAAARDSLDRAVDSGRATAGLDVVGTDGERTPYEFTAVAVPAGGDGRARLCVVGRDVSDRVTAEAELDEAVAELRRSNAELERFAYVASHDMKEPLRMVSSYLQLLERRAGDELDEEAHEFLSFAADGATRMRRMIDDLLAYSRVDRSDEPLAPVDSGSVLQSVRRNLAVTVEEADATVEVADLPTVDGDRGQLVKLFQNLVENAIKYAGDDPPHVSVDATAVDRDGGRYWEFAVADDGVGIPPEHREKVFDIFYSGNADSTGIGLAIAQKIVERHGGDIRVESAVGVGSTFYVTLPAPTDGDMSDADSS